jgi:hypothetical protein
MRFTGTITATGLPVCTNPAPPFEIYVNGNRFEALGNLGGAGVGWFIGPISGQGEFVNSWMFFPDTPSDSGVAVWSPDLSDRNGEIIFRRDPLYAACSGSPAYQLSGSQQVEVDFVTVDIGATKTTIQANEAVTFTAYPINFVSPDPNAVYWSFYTDANPSAPINVPSCTGQHTCTYTPPARGRMSASIPISGGSVPGFSATISIIRCPTGDSLLDNIRLRDSLMTALAMSGADLTPYSIRREVGGYLYYDDSGTLQIKFSYINSTPCGNTVQRPGTEVAIFHTHPFNPPEGAVQSDTLPFVCFGASGLIYDAEIFGGPSAPDWRGSVNAGKAMYVIDKKRIYKTNPTVVDSTKWRDSTKTWDWNTAACKW